MNVNDTERMYSLLEMSNYEPVVSPDNADLIIVNACSVREKPVHKVHSEIGRYKYLKRDNPSLKIGVGGCVGQQEKGNLLAGGSLIDFVFGPDNIDQLPQLVSEVKKSNKKLMGAKFLHKEAYHTETLVRNPGVTAFVNITKGCDNFCTFCIVPFTRGREKSRNLNLLLEDIRQLTDRGVKEVTLLGQNVNSYKSDCGADFADLIKAAAAKTDIERIRFTTSHPKDFNQKLVDIMAEFQDKVCEYIHLPVQSGNSEVLERMNRGYSRENYLDKVAMIEKAISNVVLSTDIIVGFPGETDEQFEDTMSLLDEVNYETMYSFKYSPRPFTKASRFEEQLTEQEKSERLYRLQAKHEEIAGKLAQKYQGQILKVLVEEFQEKRGNLYGRSRQNKAVSFVGAKELVGQTVDVKVLQAFPATLRGELL